MSWANVGRGVCVFLAVALGACERPADATALATVRENLRATATGDADATRATTHPDNPLFSQTEEILRQVRPLNLDYALERCEVTGSGLREVRVTYVQVTRRKSPETKFRDNRLTGEHILRLHEGRWKILTSKISTVEYLDP